MSLSPADIRNAVFRTSASRMRSYDKEAVDAFVEEAQREIIRMRAENRALRDEQRRGPTKQELISEIERLEDDLARAEQHARDVQVELERSRAEARSDGSGEFVDIAQRFAHQHVHDAQQDAKRLLSAARTKAEKILSEAELSASTIDSDARARHGEAVNRMFDDRAVALDEIDRLNGQLDQLRKSLRDRLALHVPEPIFPEKIPTI